MAYIASSKPRATPKGPNTSEHATVVATTLESSSVRLLGHTFALARFPTFDINCAVNDQLKDPILFAMEQVANSPIFVSASLLQY